MFTNIKVFAFPPKLKRKKKKEKFHNKREITDDIKISDISRRGGRLITTVPLKRICQFKKMKNEVKVTFFQMKMTIILELMRRNVLIFEIRDRV